MIERLVVSGFGGQGIMFLGKLIAWCAMREGKFVTFLPVYGAEVRGGTSHCSIIISDKEIASPCIDEIDTLIAMNGPSFVKFMPKVKKGGCVFVNMSIVEEAKEKKGIKFYAGHFTGLAAKMGNIRTANMIALGFYLAKKKMLSAENIIKMLPEAFNNTELIRLNEQALKKGLEDGKSSLRP